jgi:uncharacterized protein involved in response to NO
LAASSARVPKRAPMLYNPFMTPLSLGGNPPSVWRTFAAAPHRIMFTAGAIQACLGMSWWLLEILDRFIDWYDLPSLRVSPDWAHAYLMVYGFFPFFMFGFLMTALPSWVNRERPGPEYFVPSAGLMFVGVILFYPGMYLSEVLIYLGFAIQLAGWLVGLVSLAQCLHKNHGTDQRHPLVVVVGMGMGVAGLVLFDISLVAHDTPAAEVAMWSGVWLFLMPVFLAVAHRMIPFFSSRVIQDYRMVRPYWALWILIGAAVGHGLFMIFHLPRLAWLADVAGLLVSLYLLVAWRSDRALGNRLLAMVHIAFLWVPIAFSLAIWQGFHHFQYSGEGTPNVHQLAPLHALTIGFFSSMLIGMASRVTNGHSGSPLVADATTWLLFLAMNAAAVARVSAEMPWAAAVSGELLAAASAVWLLAFGIWSIKYIPMFLAPRVDGQPG